MFAFIYADLQFQPIFPYQKPLLIKVKNYFPKVDCLDVDSFSEEFLITHTCQVTQQAERCSIYFNCPEPDISLGATIRLAEVLIRRQQQSLVILQGEHQRLERLLTNRTQLTFFKNPEEQLLFQNLEDFYS
ncbi:hypothetical protein [Adhaeribacter radiodurans]|uniref:Uncharacterized protein n=1 Tax=Adhaeribacter radiodurans TaxID=2745197 RepID=A0A7L7LCM7_9BACT|nr:hypothetical protein [Adhaeribacter radiodurans]QMU30596.1 hypothetical protein HUW48_22360 [Adhaeribacter radiodurans]